MSMFEDALSIGGVVRQSVDTETGEVFTFSEVSFQDTENGNVALSTIHTTPFLVKTHKPSIALLRDGSTWESAKVTWYSGASFLKVSRAKQKKDESEKEDENKDKEIVKRGNCKGQTQSVRLRQKRELSKYRKDSSPNFVTLTYPSEYPIDPEIWKRHKDIFIKRLKRAFLTVSGHFSLQPQERGAPHWHVLVWGVSLEDLQSFVPLAWYEVVGSGDKNHLLFHEGKCGNGNEHCVQFARSWEEASSYVSKYVSKGFDGFENVGRVWGVFGKEYLPYGEKIERDITERKAVEIIRYERRFSFPVPKGKFIGKFCIMTQREKQKVVSSRRSRKRSYKSLTIICNPDFWMNKVLFA